MLKRELFPGGPEVSAVSVSLSAPPTASLPLAALAQIAPESEAPEISGEADTRTILDTALNNGLSFIDSDWITANGHAQELLGRALSDTEILVSSKVGPRLDFSGSLKFDNSRGNIINQVQDSLFRLKRDHVDLLQVHWPDETDPQQTARGLDDACHGGLARHVGVCNFNIVQIEALMQHTKIRTAQAPMSILNRTALNKVLPFCQENEIGFLVSDPLQSGLLEGQFTGNEQFTEADYDTFFQPENLPKAVKIVAELAEFASTLSLTAAQLSVVWCLNQEGVSCVLCPATPDYAQLQQVSEVKLSAKDQQTIELITSSLDN